MIVSFDQHAEQLRQQQRRSVDRRGSKAKTKKRVQQRESHPPQVGDDSINEPLDMSATHCPPPPLSRHASAKSATSSSHNNSDSNSHHHPSSSSLATLPSMRKHNTRSNFVTMGSFRLLRQMPGSVVIPTPVSSGRLPPLLKQQKEREKHIPPHQRRHCARLAIPNLPRITVDDTALFLEYLVLDEARARREKSAKFLMGLGVRVVEGFEAAERQRLVRTWSATWVSETHLLFGSMVEEAHDDVFRAELEGRLLIEVEGHEEAWRRDMVRAYEQQRVQWMAPYATEIRGFTAEIYRHRRAVLRVLIAELPHEEATLRYEMVRADDAWRVDVCLAAEAEWRSTASATETEIRRVMERQFIQGGAAKTYTKILERKFHVATTYLCDLERHGRAFILDEFKLAHRALWNTVVCVEEAARRASIGMDYHRLLFDKVAAVYAIDVDCVYNERMGRTILCLLEATMWDAMFRDMITLSEEEAADGFVRLHRFVLLSAHFDLHQLTDRGEELNEFVRLSTLAIRSSRSEEEAQHALNRALSVMTIVKADSNSLSRSVLTNQHTSLAFVETCTRRKEAEAHFSTVLAFTRAFESEERVVIVGEAISGLFTILEAHRKALKGV
eukprot:PhM_4_TR1234/c0_g1_i1/m.76880